MEPKPKSRIDLAKLHEWQAKFYRELDGLSEDELFKLMVFYSETTSGLMHRIRNRRLTLAMRDRALDKAVQTGNVVLFQVGRKKKRNPRRDRPRG